MADIYSNQQDKERSDTSLNGAWHEDTDINYAHSMNTSFSWFWNTECIFFSVINLSYLDQVWLLFHMCVSYTHVTHVCACTNILEMLSTTITCAYAPSVSNMAYITIIYDQISGMSIFSICHLLSVVWYEAWQIWFIGCDIGNGHETLQLITLSNVWQLPCRYAKTVNDWNNKYTRLCKMFGYHWFFGIGI